VHRPACAKDGARDNASSSLELSDIVRLFGNDLRRAQTLTPEQQKVLSAILACRTEALGGHVDVCLDCGAERPSYNSCRNRHCPKCQALAQARWVSARGERLLPVSYFHAVFTLPAELRSIAKLNRRTVFEAMLRAASGALIELGLDQRRLGGLLGVTTVLHTWTRELVFHPHVHCIVTGGGFSVEADRWVPGHARYLFPVRVLGELFRGKLCDALSKLEHAGELRLPDTVGPRDPQAFDNLLRRLYRKPWVVYAKRPFGGPEQVLRYLGRYTHRVGLSNQRLVSLDERGVTFRTKNGKTVTLEPVAFLARFVEHVLPSGFVKIRHYGLLAPKNISTHFARAGVLLDCVTGTGHVPPPASAHDGSGDWRRLLFELTGIHFGVCHLCRGGALERRPLPPARAPPVLAA